VYIFQVTLVANFGLLKNIGFSATTVVLEVSFMTLSSLVVGSKIVTCAIEGLLPQALNFTSVALSTFFNNTVSIN
jgi:hypothetical protein